MNGLEAAIYDKLVGDNALTSQLATPESVYAYAAPENAPLPIVIFFMQAGTAVYTLADKAVDNWVYVIKAVTEEDSMSGASMLNDLIDALFTDQPLQVNGGAALSVRRESAIPSYPEFSAGVRYNHAGSTYRIWIGD